MFLIERGTCVGCLAEAERGGGGGEGGKAEKLMIAGTPSVSQ